LKANPANAPLLGQALAAIDSLEAGKAFDTTGLNPALLPLFSPMVQPYLIDTFRYDPAKLAAAYKGRCWCCRAIATCRSRSRMHRSSRTPIFPPSW
ncbi:MAG: hypothetical protein ABI240_14950, partial [Sphingomonas sp.]